MAEIACNKMYQNDADGTVNGRRTPQIRGWQAHG
jgi:hypothetical protein